MGEETLSDITQYRRVSDRLHTAGQPTASQLAAVARAGCTAVVNLAMHDADYALPDERAAVEALGMAYVHIPVRWEAPAIDDLDRFSRVLAQREGEVLFVHCAANVRVSVFVALDRVLHRGWSAADAFAGLDTAGLPAVWQQFIRDALPRTG